MKCQVRNSLVSMAPCPQVSRYRDSLAEPASRLKTDLNIAMERHDALRSHVAGTEMASAIDLLAEQMVEFDADGAIESVKEMAEKLSIEVPEEPSCPMPASDTRS